jgi:3',5'-cyclic AMP phosphodiesterase CpdA
LDPSKGAGITLRSARKSAVSKLLAFPISAGVYVSYTYRILHIADPHFSNCHFTGRPSDVGRRHAEEIEEVLQKHTQLAPKFDAMVLSGDFTFGCQQDGFEAAQTFIDRLSVHVRPKGILAIPGNHDVNLGGDPVRIGDLSLPMPKEEAEAAFSKFLKQIRSHTGQPAGDPNHWLSMVTRVHRPDERGLVIIGLNSSRVERRDAKGWGYVGMDQIYQIADALSDSKSDNRAQKDDVLVAVIHHNPLPIWDLGLDTIASSPERRKFSFMMDAGSVLGFLADLGVGVLLHGHTHVQSAKSVDGYGSDHDRKTDSTLILGSGTFSLATGRRDARFNPAHHFQIIEIETGKGETPGLRFQDFNSLFERRDAPRKWSAKKLSTGHPLSVSWDGKRAARALREKEFDCNRAKLDYEIMQSWSVLRTKELKPDDWLRTLDELCERVKAIERSATPARVSQAVEKLFKEPPTEYDLCEWTLEQYLTRILKN